ncbi:hypothetical protein C2S52_014545 [Perilla frutescens var. hirtella]|uniref:F-box domain-containing protein n=1 Tax=Perilla frutescens var. hirtella TaxID=608512 RepID=A0AAD4IP84_PERFH|nr:hypothetical protein C2S53_004317 [Perilla frutescens var. hirtella]KAH6769742.1 hypothetical protein C2S52_014545 [Perilla frutescens var. hirtella]
MSSEPVDRLSELPDSLIYHIFSFLPMIDVVRTSNISKRWHKLWYTTPYLNFDDYTVDYNFINSARDFVNRTLILWRGSKILKFEIDFHSKYDGLYYFDFDVWLRFAMVNGVEELYIHVVYADDLIRGDGYDSIEEAYWLIESLYSCSSLKVLSLKGCNLNVDVSLHWDSLKSLTIDGYCLEEGLINGVLAGCPQLEVFILTLREIGEDLSIRSSSLKRLSIDKYICYDGDEPSRDTELRIWTPNLEALSISGVPYSKCLLMDVSSSLTEVTLGFTGCVWFSGNDFLGEILRQILPTIKYVEDVTLSDWCIKALGDMKKKDLLSPFPNVKFLHLNVCFEEHDKIMDLLQIFPELNRLVLQDEMEAGELLNFDAESKVKFETNLPKSFLLQLRRVEFTWSGGDNSIFPLIEIVLKYASKLEKMVFRVKKIVPSNLLVLAQKLLRMLKYSPTTEFIFCEN